MSGIVTPANMERKSTADAVSLQTIQETLHAELITKELSANQLFKVVCASDLMSDVLAYSIPGSLLLTSLASPQAVRTADVADILAICFVFGKQPSEETISLAAETNIPLLVSKYSLFCASGKLYSIGLAGSLPCDE